MIPLRNILVALGFIQGYAFQVATLELRQVDHKSSIIIEYNASQRHVSYSRLYCHEDIGDTDYNNTSSPLHFVRQNKSRREFFLTAAAVSSSSAFLPSQASFAASSVDQDISFLSQGNKVLIEDAKMNNNVDPFASFGESLNQMDFGNLDNSSSYEKTKNNNGEMKSIEKEKNLNDVIQEKKKQRGVDPRTHG